MDSAEFKAAREKLGLSTAGMAKALGLGANGVRTVQRIEGGAKVTGPMSLAVRKLIDDAGV